LIPSAPDAATGFADADVWFVRNDGPHWQVLTAGDRAGMRRKVVDGRRILRREEMEGVELLVLGG